MEPADQFEGYSLPTSNTTYTPNQFFDVALPYASRGAVRLVAYMIRKTLGWSDAEGRPQEPQVHFSYRQLEQHAGIGHSMIRRAIDEAVAARFIRCIREGTVNKPGVLGTPALYELHWDERGEYITNPDTFDGFFAGNGNLTYIPNDFFDHTIPTEPLALIRVVGAIIRHTIGFQTHFGFRRQKVAMSVTEIQKKTGIAGRQHIIHALQEAIERNHIVRLEMGFFDPNAGKESQPAIYGIRWREIITQEENSGHNSNTPKRLPGEIAERGVDTPKRLPGKSASNAPKRLPGRTEKVTGQYSEKVTGIEITRNNTSLNNNSTANAPKTSPIAVVDFISSDFLIEGANLLREAGFADLTARRIAAKNSAETIRQQIGWLTLRNPSRNSLGMLRRAIEENWPAPAQTALAQESLFAPDSGERSDSPAKMFAAYFYAGWAGNPGRAAAPPSSADLAAAGSYVRMLLELASDPAGIPDWGRAFGVYARNAEKDNPKVVRSLVYALRSHGDAFYVAWQGKRRQIVQKTRTEARKAHHERFQETYRVYLSACEQQIRSDSPEAFARFTEDEEEKRRKYRTGAFANSPLAERILKTHDREEERLERFCKFFQKEGLPTVLDFWEWDRQKNPERFAAGEDI